jgi:hypothetical protein
MKTKKKNQFALHTRLQYQYSKPGSSYIVFPDFTHNPSNFSSNKQKKNFGALARDSSTFSEDSPINGAPGLSY